MKFGVNIENMSNSSNINISITLSSNRYSDPEYYLDGHIQVMPDGVFIMRAHRTGTFVVRPGHRNAIRQPAPYPVHVNVLSSQQRDAERRRAAMTPSTNSGAYVPQAREVRLTSICAQHPVETLELNPDDITEVRNVVPDDLGDTCIICLSQYEAGRKVRVLLCSHKFHKNCIDKWFNVLPNCPICRMGIDGNPQEEEEEEEHPALGQPSIPNSEESTQGASSHTNVSTDSQNIIVID